jgi:DNA ligase-1
MTVMLAKVYENQAPRGWWLSEKLDGVRAIWNGRTLVSKTGKVFHAPDWFVAELPTDTILDGELWEGRGMFQQTVGKVRSLNADWTGIKYMVFDVMAEDVYETRKSVLEKLTMPGHCRVLEQTRCKSEDHLYDFEEDVLESGGEGVMLRKRGSLYEHGLSFNLLKMKNYQDDEAVVTGYTKGKGKHAGRIGALIVSYMGKVFNIGTGISDNMRRVPPKIGSVVTFSFFGLTTAGVPRHASFITVRDYE